MNIMKILELKPHKSYSSTASTFMGWSNEAMATCDFQHVRPGHQPKGPKRVYQNNSSELGSAYPPEL